MQVILANVDIVTEVKVEKQLFKMELFFGLNVLVVKTVHHVTKFIPMEFGDHYVLRPFMKEQYVADVSILPIFVM